MLGGILKGAGHAFLRPANLVWSDKHPIRSEKFGEDRLRQHAISLAESHRLSSTGLPRRSLIGLLNANYDQLGGCYSEVIAAIEREQTITPAAEWLADNFYSLGQHALQVAEDMPAGYYRKLPKLADGHLAGCPRVMAIAWAYIAHTDSHFNPVTLAEFVSAYQDIRVLTIGELWAFPIQLRLLLIDNAARIAERTVVSMRARQAADKLAEEFLSRPDVIECAKSTVGATEHHARLSYLVQFFNAVRARHLLDSDRLEQLKDLYRLVDHDATSALHEERARQAANNLSMQNIFLSLKRIAEEDWIAWVESVSHVDIELARSPVFRSCDPATRTSYRRAVEEFSRRCGKSEKEIARLAIESCGQQDPGELLIGPRLEEFSRSLGCRRRPSVSMGGAGRLMAYLAAIAVIVSLFLWLGRAAIADGQVPVSWRLLLLLLLLAPAVEAAIATVNFVVTQILPPALLPAIAFDDGIPPAFRTVVAVPVILTDFHELENHLHRLEEHYLSNPENELVYALVSDWRDAAGEEMDDDEALLQAAARGIDDLNEAHGIRQFMLFHRKRLWNAADGIWMGWERKRGKLHELNRLLRGAGNTSFVRIPRQLPQHVKYVLVLDADTQLPRGAARRLVGKMAHPLNSPRFDAVMQRIERGYGVIQPRVTFSMPEVGRGSWFQRIFAVNAGVDPYVTATSDVYQDVFGEGSFTGKGIYDIDALEAAMKGRVPDNSLLSHDLLEGSFARAGLATDIEVVEEFPERYLANEARQHRWARGDWQLLPWLLPRARGLNALSQWKMYDNLRRTLTPAATLAAFAAGLWLLPSPAANAWILYLVALLFVPDLLPLFANSGFRDEATTLASQLRTLRDDLLHAVLLTACRMTFLADHALRMLDAMLRVLYRKCVTGRLLLQWTTSAQAGTGPPPSLALSYRAMAGSVMAGLLLPVLESILGGNTGWLSIAAAGVFSAAPALAWSISRPWHVPDGKSMSADQLIQLRLVALRTWKFFEVHVTSAENFLPPDNMQDFPATRIAHRTSPTNVGLYLLSVISACEAGWIGRMEAARRLRESFDTIDGMVKFRGHLFNWYDTETLRPLAPRYVSTVDSGNLAGHCIAAANALDAWKQAPPLAAGRFDGMQDFARLAEQHVIAAASLHRAAAAAARELRQALRTFRAAMATLRVHPELAPLRLIGLIVQLRTIEAAALRLWDHAPPPQLGEAKYWLGRLLSSAEEAYAEAIANSAQQTALAAVLESMSHRLRSFAYGMDFAFLLNRQRRLLSIGYRADDEALDENCYDLLASEASLASFLAIAKNDLDVSHWSRLGRPVTAVRGEACLASWSGSMFEYLMPLLVTTYREGTLLAQTMRLAVSRQIEYGRSIGTPWGISESAFAARDKAFSYQYSNFGVPGLGLKRGLSSNQVIAPYATALAAMVDPAAAAGNFKRLAAIGAEGQFGFYEALDFTPHRLRRGQRHELVRAYFAHHQGMTVCAICNAVLGGVLREHFRREGIVRASELLLQERSPHYLPVKVTTLPRETVAKVRMARDEEPSRRVVISGVSRPITHLLSNGSYSLMLTATGGGYSRWKGLAINRWREDPTQDSDGLLLFFKCAESGTSWTIDQAASAGGLPPEAAFNPDKVEFLRSDDDISTHVECMLASEEDAEARIIHLANTSGKLKTIECTSYMELALALPESDDSHPAFSKLFITTSYVEGFQAVLATRRKRQESDPDIWVGQFLFCEGPRVSATQFETSREVFLDRGNEPVASRVFGRQQQFSSTTGDVLDPVIALRRRVTLAPHRKRVLVLWTVAAYSRESLLEKIGRFSTSSAVERVQVMAWTHSRILLRHLGISAAEATLYQSLAAMVVYSSPLLRPAPREILEWSGQQSLLWSIGLPGTRPVIVVEIDGEENLPLVSQVLEARNFWLEMGLAADVVVLNRESASYSPGLAGHLEALLARAEAGRSYHPGAAETATAVLRLGVTPSDVVNAVLAAAAVVLNSNAGSLQRQVATAAPGLARLRRQRGVIAPPLERQDIERPKLLFDNGYGGFTEDGREYVILHRADRPLPAPWINVIANPAFGTHCSAEGGGYSWHKNSREGQITRWSNDAVTDVPSEVFYVRDQVDGTLSSPTVMPLGRRAGTFTSRHGFGFTRHIGEENGLCLALTHTIACVDPVKLSRLRIENPSTVTRTLRITFYAEVVLGARRQLSARHVTSRMDAESNALFLQNRFNADFGKDVVFADLCGAQTSFSADRFELLGWRGSLFLPDAVAAGGPLSGRFGGGLDPCMALSCEVSIPPGGAHECVLLLGAAGDAESARKLIIKYRATSFDDVLQAQRMQWQSLCGNLQVKSPEPAFDVMMNGWLMYQTVSCRFWGRAGFYQASGAFGFRDQLQDGLTVALVRPDLAREHILRAASRQFIEGDVQHWWLPETGAGVRTRITDDTIWLVYCTCKYLELTQDNTVLEERVGWLEAAPLDQTHHEAFSIPRVSQRVGSLYEHCVAALSRSLAFGNHGLPLMGTGDWNDGMNKIGEKGRGESVWLGFFLMTTLAMFKGVAERRNDTDMVNLCESSWARLEQALQSEAWDGAWYRRAYFDDGTPLGTAKAEECRIDSIAQSWAVLSGSADLSRASQAVASAEANLIDWNDRIASLFWPPLRNHEPNAGYVQSYPAGVRENGGQYTHAAIWMIFALARLQRAEEPLRLFQLVNPVCHSATQMEAERYRVEPFVLAADVYAVAPHRGRGGWTWYTGSAGWAYRAGLEAILGIRREANILSIDPRLPASWTQVRVAYGHAGKRITIDFRAGRGGRRGLRQPTVIDLAAAREGQVFRIRL